MGPIDPVTETAVRLSPTQLTVPFDSTLLEAAFAGVTILVLLLLIVLIFIFLRSRFTQSRFKLLDNSDGVSSYHSLSPKDALSPLLSTVSSPSPQPPNHQKPSSVSLSEYQSPSSRLYDRSRLTPLPLQQSVSSRTPSPHQHRSPSSPLLSPSPTPPLTVVPA